ncbi:hypothetical protein AB0J47_41935, partial [Nocardia sp. NPDC049737]
MTEIETRTEPPDLDIHRAELAAAPGPGAMVRYARMQLHPDATPPQVRDWLAAYGHKISRSTLYDNMKEPSVSAPRGITDTSDLPKLTDEQLAALDAATAAGVAAVAPSRATAEVGAEQAGPSAAAGIAPVAEHDQPRAASLADSEDFLAELNAGRHTAVIDAVPSGVRNAAGLDTGIPVAVPEGPERPEEGPEVSGLDSGSVQKSGSPAGHVPEVRPDT